MLELDGQVKLVFRGIEKKITGGQKFNKTLELGILYTKGVYVFIYNKWWMQLTKYPKVSWHVIINSISKTLREECILPSIVENLAT